MEWIETLLVRWGVWSSRKENNGLGYPHRSITFKLAPSGETNPDFLPVDGLVLQIDRSIAELGMARPELKRLAMLMYVRAFPVSSIARLEHVTERAVWKRKSMLLAILAREYHKTA